MLGFFGVSEYCAFQILDLDNYVCFNAIVISKGIIGIAIKIKEIIVQEHLIKLLSRALLLDQQPALFIPQKNIIAFDHIFARYRMGINL